MVLATRCPHCETVFRVQETLLAASGGFARCGHCQQVFDARSNLLDPHAGEQSAVHEPASSSLPSSFAHDDARAEHQARASDAVSNDEAEAAAQAEAQAQAETQAQAEAQAQADAQARAQAEREAAEAEASSESIPLASEPTPPHESHAAGEPTAPSPDAPHVEPETSAFNEPARDGNAEPAATPSWGASHEPRWHDDEPHFGAHAPADVDVEPHFGATPPAAAKIESEPDFASRTGARYAEELEESEGEPHLEPHLRARLQAQAEAAGEPDDAGVESHVHAASVPPVFAQPPASDEHERHFAVTRETRARTPSRVLWYLVGSLLCVALVVVLIAQLAWWRREAVMVYWPDSQPIFARVCEKLGCQLSPPRDIDGLRIEVPDLRQVDGPHHLELRVPLRNRYGLALAYPAIELTLSDEKNNVVVRRILWPQDYVPPGTTIAAGLPAHATQTMIVRLESGNAVATNFRVQIFYP